MTTQRLTGQDAIDYARRNNVLLCKYNDPIEDAREDVTLDEAEDIAREDAGLLYIDVQMAKPQPARKPYAKPLVTRRPFEHLIDLECKCNPSM